MAERRTTVGLLVTASAIGACSLLLSAADSTRAPNIIIFVADGLRPGSVNPADAPALFRIRNEGVNFVNSHSLFPTVTMVNAAAIATGHYPGDTGQFDNTLFVGRRLFSTGNFGLMPGTLTPNVENDRVLADINGLFQGNYVGEPTLLSVARAHGYNTAAIGKTGPTALQDVSHINVANRQFTTTSSIIIDGATGTAAGIPLDDEVAKLIAQAGLGAGPPARTQSGGTNVTPGTLSANIDVLEWQADATTKAILPMFVASGKPFLLVFWSGDPDVTQHSQGDSLNSLTPGINGPTSRAAVQNADAVLKRLMDYVAAQPALRDSTDIFVTSDHGFSTASRHDIDAARHVTSSYSSTFTYRDATGREEVNTGFLPPGALAIDLARGLGLPLFAPDAAVNDTRGEQVFASIDPTVPKQTETVRQHPAGDALIGGTGRVGTVDAKIILAGNSLYVPDHDGETVRRAVALLATLDYVGALFVHDSYGRIPGALPMSAIGHVGATLLPFPAIIVAPLEFSLDPKRPDMTSVIVGDSPQHGQGAHGALARANTFNNMAAFGPDFKKHFVDQSPVGNADIAVTLARVIGVTLPGVGALRGRVLSEALAGGPRRMNFQRRVMRSEIAASGKATILKYQQIGSQRYVDEACLERTDCSRGGSVSTN